jgi:hypothetical protein
VSCSRLSYYSPQLACSSEASFIYPFGEEHGFNAIEQHVFQNVMAATFSARDLQTRGVTV